MSTPIVEVKHLSHRYSVDWAIRDINFSVEKKGILGLLGSNGAGKSTTMNIICGVLNQTEGDVFINGIDLRKNPVEAKKHIGFLPQKPPLHPDLTVDEYLVHCAVLRRMPPKEIRKAVEYAKERCAISHFSNRLIKNLSGLFRRAELDRGRPLCRRHESNDRRGERGRSEPDHLLRLPFLRAAGEELQRKGSVLHQQGLLQGGCRSKNRNHHRRPRHLRAPYGAGSGHRDPLLSKPQLGL